MRKDETNIRWIVIGLHDALYALLIEKLERTDGFGIFNDRFEDEVAEFYEKGLGSRSQEFADLVEKSLSQNIAGVGKLLKRINLPSGAVIKVSEVDKLSRPSLGLSHLKEMRDFFAHPRPMTSGYYEDWLIDTIDDTIEVIKEVLTVAGQRRSYHDPEEAKVILSSIEFYFKRWALSHSTR